MKTSVGRRFSTLMLLALLGTDSSPSVAQGTIIPNNVVFVQPPAAPPGTYISQMAYPGNLGGLFAISVTTLGVGHYRFAYYGIAELYSIHSASLDLALTPAYVLGDTPLLNNNNNPGLFDVSLSLGQSRYFAYWDDALYSSVPPGTAQGVPDARGAYGWFRLTRTVSGLTISDSATAMGNGIYVGTYTAVPEPSCLAFAAVALLGLMSRRLR